MARTITVVVILVGLAFAGGWFAHATLADSPGAGKPVTKNELEEVEEEDLGPTAEIFVQMSQPTTLETSKQPIDKEEWRIYRRTMGEWMKSDLVLRAAMRQREFQADPVAKSQGDPSQWLKKKLVVKSQDDSQLINVALPGVEPKSAATIVNLVVGALIREIVDKDRLEKIDRLNKLKGMLQDGARDLRSIRQDYYKRLEVIGKDRSSVDVDEARDMVSAQEATNRKLQEAITLAEIELLAAPRVRITDDASE